MKTKGLILAAALLAGSCSPESQAGGKTKEDLQKPASQASYVDRDNTGFAIPEETAALEAEIRRRLEQSLQCEGPVLFASEEGAYREPNRPTSAPTIFLGGDPICIKGQIRTCTAMAFQYDGQGEMVNGFSVVGVCQPVGYTLGNQSLANNGLSPDINLSERLEERALFGN